MKSWLINSAETQSETAVQTAKTSVLDIEKSGGTVNRGTKDIDGRGMGMTN